MAIPAGLRRETWGLVSPLPQSPTSQRTTVDPQWVIVVNLSTGSTFVASNDTAADQPCPRAYCRSPQPTSAQARPGPGPEPVPDPGLAQALPPVPEPRPPTQSPTQMPGLCFKHLPESRPWLNAEPTRTRARPNRDQTQNPYPQSQTTPKRRAQPKHQPKTRHQPKPKHQPRARHQPRAIHPTHSPTQPRPQSRPKPLPMTQPSRRRRPTTQAHPADTGLATRNEATEAHRLSRRAHCHAPDRESQHQLVIDLEVCGSHR